MTKAIGTRIAATVLLGLVLLLAPAALAAKGGKGKPNGGSGTASLAVSPNPVPAFSEFRGYGCGYSGPQVGMNLSSPYWQAAFPAYPDADGCISFTFWVDGTGSYTLKAFTPGRKPTLIKSMTFSVV